MSEASEQVLAPSLASSRAERYRVVPDYERHRIIAKRLHGIPVKRIAEQHNIDPVTVWRICKEMHTVAQEVAHDTRTEQITLALESVNRALVDDSDTYKSAGIGVQVLKGLGVYAADNSVQVNLAQWLGNKPAGCEEIEASLSEEPTPIGSETPSLHNTSRAQSNTDTPID